jgi:hypothetical protein
VGTLDTRSAKEHDPLCGVQAPGEGLDHGRQRHQLAPACFGERDRPDFHVRSALLGDVSREDEDAGVTGGNCVLDGDLHQARGLLGSAQDLTEGARVDEDALGVGLLEEPGPHLLRRDV